MDKRTNRVRGLTVVAAVGALMLGQAGCSMFSNGPKNEWSLNGSPKIPAAQGKVQVTLQGEDNKAVAVSAEHLAHPDQAFPGTTTYVVWVVPSEGKAPLNMGALSLGEDLSAHFETQTPYRNFKLLVTAERAANVVSPSDNVAFTAMVDVPG